MLRHSPSTYRVMALTALIVACGTIAGAQRTKPRIVIVATGGTIAGAAESTTAAGYKSGAVAVDVLISAVPQMKQFADVTGVQVSSVGSQDMNDETWVKLALVRRNIEVDDDKAGTVTAMELNPSKARVLLKLALTISSDAKQVQEFFTKY